MTPLDLAPYGVAAVLFLLGGVLTDNGPWFASLKKPPWRPPPWVFAPAWAVILGCAALAAAKVVADRGFGPLGPFVLGLFGVNAALHAAWTPLFFRLRRPDWALIEMAMLWLSVAAIAGLLLQKSAALAALMAPYGLWVSVALALNWAIVRLNGPFGRARPEGPGPTPT